MNQIQLVIKAANEIRDFNYKIWLKDSVDAGAHRQISTLSKIEALRYLAIQNAVYDKENEEKWTDCQHRLHDIWCEVVDWYSTKRGAA